MRKGSAWILLFVGSPVFAQVQPTIGTGDPHIQWIKYDPNQIVQLQLTPDHQTLVELARGEHIDTIAIGSSEGWQVTPGKRGDFFFIKNIQSVARTNLTVVTDSHNYVFELSMADGYGVAQPYILRFLYNIPPLTTETSSNEAQYSYRIKGAKMIRPSHIYNSGNQTRIEWPEDSPLPAIFLLENGEETMANGDMQDGYFVISGMPEKLIFRLDGQVASATRIISRGVKND